MALEEMNDDVAFGVLEPLGMAPGKKKMKAPQCI